MKGAAQSGKKQKGISLIEVLVSAVLISMIFLWISDTHMASLTDIADTNHRSKVILITEEIIERIKVNPLLDKYRAEIDRAKNISVYCRSPAKCFNRECSEDEIIKYDVQQIICNNLEGLDGLEMVFECFDITNGRRLNPCSLRGTLRGRITASWNSKDPSRGRLSIYSEVLFVVNQSLYFDGSNDYLRADGSLFAEDFTISMWARPDRLSGDQGLFGKEESSGLLRRSPTLFVSSGGGLYYDSYNINLVNNIIWCIPVDHPICKLRPFIKKTTADRYTSTVGNFFSKGEWTHVTWIRKGTEYLFYRNGALLSRKIGIPKDLHDKGDNWIGRVGSRFFQGELDDVMVYGSALSEAQILGVMGGHLFEDKNLLLYLDFEGESFNEVIKGKSAWALSRAISSYGGLNDDSRRHTVR